jgi:hypothetical protein
MKKNKNPPFVMVTNQVLDSPAWRAMSHGARSLYVALKRRYSPNGRNNGRIRLSQREAREQLGAGFTQITRWFAELQHYGFIVMVEPGCLGVHGKGKAPCWRLTEVAYMRGTSSKGMDDMPTMDFLKWPGVRFSKHHSGGDHLPQQGAPENRSTLGPSRKTESRSRKPEQSAPENRSTSAPENQSAKWNKRSRKPEHTASQSAPENRSISYKPSGEGGRDSLQREAKAPTGAHSSLQKNGQDATRIAEPTADGGTPVQRCAECGGPADASRGPLMPDIHGACLGVRYAEGRA